MSIQNANLPLTLPVITIDPTFPSVIQDVDDGVVPSEKFWISCYKASLPSVHAKIHVELDEINRNLVHLRPKEGDVEIVRPHGSTQGYNVACKPLGILPTRVMLPVQEYLDPERSNPQRPHRITAFDIAPDDSKFVTGFLDGSVLLYPTSLLPAPSPHQVPHKYTITNERIISKPHLSTVTHLRFFPSSRVLLSAGADFSLSILPAELPSVASMGGTRISPVRTLRAHTRSITSTGIIGLGRNIISTSLDSTLKLWDVPSSSPITSVAAHSPILSSSLGDRTPTPPDGEEFVLPATNAPDERELPETQSKMVFCGLQNGSFEQFDLGLKKSVYKSTPASASGLSSINYSSSHNLLATGSSTGVVTLYDTRALGVPLTSFRRNEAGIEDLGLTSTTSGEVGVAIATADGLPYLASVVPEGPAVAAELVGGDCDPVRNVRVRQRTDSDGKMEVWSAGDDAIVRRYLI